MESERNLLNALTSELITIIQKLKEENEQLKKDKKAYANLISADLKLSHYKEISNQRIEERIIMDNKIKENRARLDSILIDNGLKELVDKRK